MRRIFLYFNTLRYLKWQQFIYRFKLFLPPKKQVLPKKTPEINAFFWPGNYFGEASFNKKNKAKFLNNEEDISKSSIWNSETLDKLWLYNLHYFDDLNSQDNEQKKEFHVDLILRWIDENPINIGIGWDSYPVSLRVVNWIKWYGRSGIHNKRIIESLYLQSKKLSSSVEYHLLGNHLIANCKALIFAGIFFKGLHGEKFLKQGVSILKKELREQFHEDGGHFELSPMYHSILLNDLLDILNLLKISKRNELIKIKKNLEEKCNKALNWLETMTHPDGGLSYFNDSVNGICPPFSFLREYASSLDIKPSDIENKRLTSHLESGYSILQTNDSFLILDHGDIGPDYIPGHGHADTLSFELSYKKNRIFVNKGISTYEKNDKRNNERKTFSHNTIELNSTDSSIVWGGFRVANRARASLLNAEDSGDDLIISASHDGYTKLFRSLVHQREIRLSKRRLLIKDSFLGDFKSACSYLHLHPDVSFQLENPYEGSLNTKSGEKLSIIFSSPIYFQESFWCETFGKELETKTLCQETDKKEIYCEIIYP